MDDMNPITKTKTIVPIITAVVAIAGAVFLYVQLAGAKSELNDARARYVELETQFAEQQEENRALSEALYSEQEKNKELEDDFEDIADTVDQLEKLSKTDPELLQKYSKVYFLNEHYAPPAFAEIDSKYLYPEDDVEHVHKRVWPFLEKLLEAAKKDKIDLRITSAFRSFGEQSSLKSQYAVTYGAGANQFSADQGYSEHQLGTTVDFTTAATKGALDGFDATPAYTWLLENAHLYGFVLSYPKDNAYYVFEPWHWRFVGVDLAEYLHRKKIGFYDMEQRDIDKYLVKIFDR